MGCGLGEGANDAAKYSDGSLIYSRNCHSLPVDEQLTHIVCFQPARHDNQGSSKLRNVCAEK